MSIGADSEFFSKMVVKKAADIDVGNNQGRGAVICCKRWKLSSEMNGLKPMVSKKSEYEDMVDLTSSLSLWLDNPRGVPIVVSDGVVGVLPSIPGVADCLVHWEMPQASKKNFSVRVFFVKDTHHHVPERRQLKTAEVYLLLGQRDKHNIPTLVPLLTRSGGVVPNEVLEEVDNEKHGMGRLCERMVEGRLNCPSHCGGRHWLDRTGVVVVDRTGLVVDRQLEGIKEFMLLRVETLVLYWVRGMDSLYNGDFKKRVLRTATQHFCMKESCVSLSPELIGVVAVDGDDKVYHRTSLLELECKEYKDIDKVTKVKFFLFDEGIAGSFHPSRIYKLPESLGLFVAGATPVMVTGILPPDKYPDWSTECAVLVAGYLTPVQRIDREGVRSGRVLLQTTTMLWVDRCQMKVKQPTIARFVLHFGTLVTQNWSIPKAEHAQYIHKLAVEGGLEIERTRSSQPDQTIEKPLQYADIPRTAFLPLHSMVPVCMSESVTPGKFYLQPSSQLNSLTRLEPEVATWAKEHQQSGYLLLKVVLAKVKQESQYLRAEVKHVGDRLVEFMVDIGDMSTLHMENTLPCPESLAFRIPHQAVQCSLTYVVSGDWVVEAGDKLFELSRDSLEIAKEAVVNFVTCHANGKGDEYSRGEVAEVSQERFSGNELILIKHTKVRTAKSIIMKRLNDFYYVKMECIVQGALCVVKRVMISESVCVEGSCVEVVLCVYCLTNICTMVSPLRS